MTPTRSSSPLSISSAVFQPARKSAQQIHSLSELFACFKEKGFITASGYWNKKIPLPSLSPQENARGLHILSKEFWIIDRDDAKLKKTSFFELWSIISQIAHNENIPLSGFEIAGSTVFSILGSSYIEKILLNWGFCFSESLKNEIDASFSQVSDLDIRVEVSDKNAIKAISHYVVQALVAICQGLTYGEIKQKAFLKFTLDKENFDFFSFSLGEKGGFKIDIVFYHKLDRLHLFMKDALRLFYQGNQSPKVISDLEVPFQAICDKLFKFIHVDDPQNVDIKGWFIFLSSLVKKHKYFENDIESNLRKTVFKMDSLKQGLTEIISAYLVDIWQNHHSKENELFCLGMTASYFLKESSISNQLERIWKTLGSQIKEKNAYFKGLYEGAFQYKMLAAYLDMMAFSKNTLPSSMGANQVNIFSLDDRQFLFARQPAKSFELFFSQPKENIAAYLALEESSFEKIFFSFLKNISPSKVWALTEQHIPKDQFDAYYYAYIQKLIDFEPLKAYEILKNENLPESTHLELCRRVFSLIDPSEFWDLFLKGDEIGEKYLLLLHDFIDSLNPERNLELPHIETIIKDDPACVHKYKNYQKKRFALLAQKVAKNKHVREIWPRVLENTELPEILDPRTAIKSYLNYFLKDITPFSLNQARLLLIDKETESLLSSEYPEIISSFLKKAADEENIVPLKPALFDFLIFVLEKKLYRAHEVLKIIARLSGEKAGIPAKLKTLLQKQEPLLLENAEPEEGFYFSYHLCLLEIKPEQACTNAAAAWLKGKTASIEWDNRLKTLESFGRAQIVPAFIVNWIESLASQNLFERAVFWIQKHSKAFSSYEEKIVQFLHNEKASFSFKKTIASLYPQALREISSSEFNAFIEEEKDGHALLSLFESALPQPERNWSSLVQACKRLNNKKTADALWHLIIKKCEFPLVYFKAFEVPSKEMKPLLEAPELFQSRHQEFFSALLDIHWNSNDPSHYLQKLFSLRKSLALGESDWLKWLSVLNQINTKDAFIESLEEFTKLFKNPLSPVFHKAFLSWIDRFHTHASALHEDYIYRYNYILSASRASGLISREKIIKSILKEPQLVYEVLSQTRALIKEKSEIKDKNVVFHTLEYLSVKLSKDVLTEFYKLLNEACQSNLLLPKQVQILYDNYFKSLFEISKSADAEELKFTVLHMVENLTHFSQVSTQKEAEAAEKILALLSLFLIKNGKTKDFLFLYHKFNFAVYGYSLFKNESEASRDSKIEISGHTESFEEKKYLTPWQKAKPSEKHRLNTYTIYLLDKMINNKYSDLQSIIHAATFLHHQFIELMDSYTKFPQNFASALGRFIRWIEPKNESFYLAHVKNLKKILQKGIDNNFFSQNPELLISWRWIADSYVLNETDIVDLDIFDPYDVRAAEIIDLSKLTANGKLATIFEHFKWLIACSAPFPLFCAARVAIACQKDIAFGGNNLPHFKNFLQLLIEKLPENAFLRPDDEGEPFIDFVKTGLTIEMERYGQSLNEKTRLAIIDLCKLFFKNIQNSPNFEWKRIYSYLLEFRNKGVFNKNYIDYLAYAEHMLSKVDFGVHQEQLEVVMNLLVANPLHQLTEQESKARTSYFINWIESLKRKKTPINKFYARQLMLCPDTKTNVFRNNETDFNSVLNLI